MHALRGYGALFRAAISGGNVVRGHAIAEQLSGTRVRVRRQVRAGLWEGGKHRLMRMVGGSGSNGAEVSMGQHQNLRPVISSWLAVPKRSGEQHSPELQSGR